jgi:hypothetical protein
VRKTRTASVSGWPKVIVSGRYPEKLDSTLSRNSFENHAVRPSDTKIRVHDSLPDTAVIVMACSAVIVLASRLVLCGARTVTCAEAVLPW